LITICENYKEYRPPSSTRRTVEKLLSSLPERYQSGLQSVVLTNAVAVNLGKTGRINGKKYRRKECRGFYHPRQRGDPAWIEIVVDNVIADTPGMAMKVPLIRETLFAGTLFHEIGHHLDTTIGAPAPTGEAAAEAWNKRLFAQYLLKHYWYAVPILKVFRALFGGTIRRRVAAWKRKHNTAGQAPNPPHPADANKRRG
jgi:hypothetical protein